MEKYKFNTSELSEGEQFKNFKGLFLAVTGRTPPSGKTLTSVKASLAKYLEYELEKNINPNTASKQSVIITKIYNPPLITIEGRGKKGKYSDHLKPLILSTSFYEGKIYGLFNQWGVFRDYISYLQKNDKEIAQTIECFGTNQCNIWMKANIKNAGELEYKRHLWYTMRNACERALDSLQNDGLINWSKYYRMIPSVLTDIEGRSERRFKSAQERRGQNKKREEFINNVTQDENCLLQPKLLETLDIFSPNWDSGEVTLNKYKELVSLNKYINTPLKATSKQAAAIKIFELFLRQHTFKEYNKESHYRKIEELPNEKEFFDNFKLAFLYRSRYKEYAELLINCICTWKEIEFSAGPNKADSESSQQDTTGKDIPDKLTIAFIEYMEGQMSKHKYILNKGSLEDCVMAIGSATQGLEYYLKSSKSANELHELLKSLYNVQNDSMDLPQ